MNIVVTVGDMKTGTNGDLIVTHALGSCLGLVAFDPVSKVGGMLHAMLPLSKINPEKAVVNPYMFVDTGVPALFNAVYNLGGVKSRLVVKAAGCGHPLGNGQMFDVGRRNLTVLKKLLTKNGILIDNEDVGGTESRTLYFEVATGKTLVGCKGQKREL